MEWDPGQWVEFQLTARRLDPARVELAARLVDGGLILLERPPSPSMPLRWRAGKTPTPSSASGSGAEPANYAAQSYP